MYPHALLERERYGQLVKQRRALGELDHPESSVINLQNVTSCCRNMDGRNKVMGKIEVLPTPSGQILQNLVQEGFLVVSLLEVWGPLRRRTA